MVNRHRKRCSTSLIIKELQLKTTRRYYLTPVKTATIRKSINNKWQGGREKGTTVTIIENVNWCCHNRKQYGDFSKT